MTGSPPALPSFRPKACARSSRFLLLDSHGWEIQGQIAIKLPERSRGRTLVRYTGVAGGDPGEAAANLNALTEMAGCGGTSRGTTLAWLVMTGLIGSGSGGLYAGNGSDVEDLIPARLAEILASPPPSSALLLEFYASWCGHCQAFAPEYARLASNLRRRGWAIGLPAAIQNLGRLTIEIAAIDCAAYGSVCNSWDVQGYPTMRLLVPGSYNTSATVLPRVSHTEAAVLMWLYTPLRDLCTTADGAPLSCATLRATTSTSWYMTDANSTWPAATAKNTITTRPSSTPGDPGTAIGITTTTSVDGCAAIRAPLDGIVAAEADGVASFEFAFAHELWRGATNDTALLPEADDAARRLLAEMAAGFPTWGPYYGHVLDAVNRDHTSSGTTKAQWDAARDEATGLGYAPSVFPTWSAFCQGEFTQYTCGLWAGFHSLLERAPTDSRAVAVLAAMVGFVDAVFECYDCRAHFLNMSRGLEHGLAPSGTVTSRRAAIDWLWAAHNRVNCRLGSGVFPSSANPGGCPDCRLAGAVAGPGPTGWDVDAVSAYLHRTYRLVSPQQSSTAEGGHHGPADPHSTKITTALPRVGGHHGGNSSNDSSNGGDNDRNTAVVVAAVVIVSLLVILTLVAGALYWRYKHSAADGRGLGGARSNPYARQRVLTLADPPTGMSLNPAYKA